MTVKRTEASDKLRAENVERMKILLRNFYAEFSDLKKKYIPEIWSITDSEGWYDIDMYTLHDGRDLVDQLDELATTYAWISDRINGNWVIDSQPKYSKSMTKKIRTALGYTEISNKKRK